MNHEKIHRYIYIAIYSPELTYDSKKASKTGYRQVPVKDNDKLVREYLGLQDIVDWLEHHEQYGKGIIFWYVCVIMMLSYGKMYPFFGFEFLRNACRNIMEEYRIRWPIVRLADTVRNTDFPYNVKQTMEWRKRELENCQKDWELAQKGVFDFIKNRDEDYDRFIKELEDREDYQPLTAEQKIRMKARQEKFKQEIKKLVPSLDVEKPSFTMYNCYKIIEPARYLWEKGTHHGGYNKLRDKFNADIFKIAEEKPLNHNNGRKDYINHYHGYGEHNGNTLRYLLYRLYQFTD